MAEQVDPLDTQNPRIKRNLERKELLQRIEQLEKWLRFDTMLIAILTLFVVALWLLVLLH